MNIVLIILVLFLIISILIAILKRDGDKPQILTQPPTTDTQYPDIQLLSVRVRPKQGSHTTPPQIPNKIPHPFDYDTPWWRDYSYWVRAQKKWCCDECGISLKDNHEMLHTHHVNGINRNTLSDLQALCIGCHAEQLGRHHRQLKKRRTYKRFMERYGKQWRAYCEQMGFEI